jgi:ATP-dependent RNA helicase DHX8/PRP22
MLSKLQRLSLVSKVYSELDTHMGMSNKTLAEFIIHLGQDSKSAAEFGEKLAATGTEFSSEFSETLFATITRMSVAIVPARRSGAGRASSSSSSGGVGGTAFKALALPDRDGPVPLMGMAHESDPATRGRSSGGGGGGGGAGASFSQERPRSEGDAAADDRHVRPRGGSRFSDGAAAASSSSSAASARVHAAPLTEPELYGIYDGTVSKLMDFGAFVELDGFARGTRVEGLVHVSRLTNGGSFYFFFLTIV